MCSQTFNFITLFYLSQFQVPLQQWLYGYILLFIFKHVQYWTLLLLVIESYVSWKLLKQNCITSAKILGRTYVILKILKPETKRPHRPSLSPLITSKWAPRPPPHHYSSTTFESSMIKYTYYPTVSGRRMMRSWIVVLN